MLTNVQKGMIAHQLRLRINKLVGYFAKIKKNKAWYEQVIEIVNNAYNNTTKKVNTDTTSDKLALNKTTVLCIAYELSCIFNPDFDAK